MRLVIFIEPQNGASYADQVRVAQHAEELGFDGFFRSDHFLAMTESGLPGPTDSWTTLSGIALQTSRIRLGTLVTSATFRLPGPLAISVAQADQMSGGRMELGLGAGWFEEEHTAYGIPFPPVGERFERLTEQLEIITGLWRTPAGEHFDYAGRHYQLAKSPALPKPAQDRLPVIVGGFGPRRTPALAARFADEFNVPFAPVEKIGEQFRRVTRACAEAGRSAPIAFSAAQTVACGRTEAEVRRRTEATGKVPELSGTPAQVAEQIAALAAVGARRIFLQVLDLADLDHLDVLAELLTLPLGDD